MSDNNLTGFLIRRELPDPITREELDKAVEDSGNALKELRKEDTDIKWIDSEVMAN